MDNVIKQRLKLQQKKAKIITEEAKLKIIERKVRTRRLIELGGLIAKAKLDDLPTNSLFGALYQFPKLIIMSSYFMISAPHVLAVRSGTRHSYS